MADYNTWKANKSGPIDTEALTYAVIHLNQTGVVWEAARSESYPRNLALFRSLAATDDLTIIRKMLRGRREVFPNDS